MARARPRRRTARPAPVADGRRDRPAVERPRSPGGGPGVLRWWRQRSTGTRAAMVAAILGFLTLVGVNVWIGAQPARPDVNALHSDIAAGRSGAEVTFAATLVSEPAESGGHERMSVRDQLGDVLELDYNTSLGRVIPVHAGSSIVVHGQLYIDAGQAGVHCLHGQTSSGCPQPGWIQYAGATYS